MASAHFRSGTRGRPPPKRCVFTCSGSRGSSTAQSSSEMRKPVVVRLFGVRARVRFVVGTYCFALVIPPFYQLFGQALSITTTTSGRDPWRCPALGGAPLLMRAPGPLVALLYVLQPAQQLSRPEPLPGQHLPHHPVYLRARDLGQLFPPNPAAGSTGTLRPAGTG
jgi:hypothetical protein